MKTHLTLLNLVALATACVGPVRAIAAAEISLSEMSADILPGRDKEHGRFCEWCGKNKLVYDVGSTIQCIDPDSTKITWTRSLEAEVAFMNVRGDRLALITKQGAIGLVSDLGRKEPARLQYLNTDAMAQIDSKCIPQAVFATSKELVVVTKSESFSKSGFIIDLASSSVIHRFSVDPFRIYIDLAVDGQNIVTSTVDGLLSVRNIRNDVDVFTSRTRNKSTRFRANVDGPTFGQPFYSDLGGLLVYTERNGWRPGKVVVRSTESRRENSFEVESGWQPIDVSFKKSRIVSVSREGDLFVWDFSGKPLAVSRRAIQGKCDIARISPDGKSILLSTTTNYALFAISPGHFDQ